MLYVLDRHVPMLVGGGFRNLVLADQSVPFLLFQFLCGKGCRIPIARFDVCGGFDVCFSFSLVSNGPLEGGMRSPTAIVFFSFLFGSELRHH